MKHSNPRETKPVSRREFLGKAAAVSAAVSLVPRRVLGGRAGKAPSDTVNIACIGVGGKGTDDSLAAGSQNVVALCDVDDAQMAGFLERVQKDRPELANMYRKARKYRDFRRMLDENAGTIDAVTISIPDHNHAVAAMAALRMKKHVYCQKPLTHTIFEARKLAEEAARAGVATQMGNQGHASEGARLVNEWIADGAIGPVREVHCWTNRPIWPQGIERPKEIPSVPPTLDWDLWLGPAAWRPYHPAYCPFSWRGWWDFGTGVVGDMGAHIIDHPYWALELKYPTTVQASSTRFTEDSYPQASIITYSFPARGHMPPVTLKWYDGGLMPPRPEELEPGRKMAEDTGGILFVGDKGKLITSCYGNNPRLIPESRMQEYRRPAKTIPRSPGIVEEWIAAIKAGRKSTTDFGYSGPLTETMLLGNIAIRMKGSNQVLEWDADKMEITNLPEANEFMRMTCRQGWTL
jgi:predicted dehydrogenase